MWVCVCVCVWGVCVCVCVGRCVWVCVGVCVCLAYTSEDFHMKTPRHTEDSTPSEDPKTGPRKTLAKNAKNVMFYHLRGVRAPRTSMDFQPYLIYEDIRVLGSISKASRGVCVCVCVCVFLSLLPIWVFLKCFIFVGDWQSCNKKSQGDEDERILAHRKLDRLTSIRFHVLR